MIKPAGYLKLSCKDWRGKVFQHHYNVRHTTSHHADSLSVNYAQFHHDFILHVPCCVSVNDRYFLFNNQYLKSDKIMTR